MRKLKGCEGVGKVFVKQISLLSEPLITVSCGCEWGWRLGGGGWWWWVCGGGCVDSMICQFAFN